MTRNRNLPVLYTALFLLVTSAEAQLANAQTRLRRPIDPARVVALSGHVNPRARAEFDRGPVDPSMPVPNVILGLKLTPAQQADLEQFLAGQQNPASLDYHRWLTPSEFAARFGASQADIDQTAAWLRSQGLTVETISQSRNWISFSGTADTVGRALHTEFHRYDIAGVSHFANAIEPSVPEAIATAVSGISGLHDFRRRGAQRPMSTPLATSPDGSHVPSPADYAVIYNIQQLYNLGIDGTGLTIAIAGQSNIKTSDLNLFRNRFNLGPANFTTKTFGP